MQDQLRTEIKKKGAQIKHTGAMLFQLIMAL